MPGNFNGVRAQLWANEQAAGERAGFQTEFRLMSVESVTAEGHDEDRRAESQNFKGQSEHQGTEY